MKYLLGCDFGGGASKATLLRADGKIAATATAEYPTIYPKPGWAEQDPDKVYDAFLYNVKAVLEKSGVDPQEIAAIALDGATHTAVLLDQDDRVIRPAIYWTDTRSAKEAEELKASHAKEIMDESFHLPGAMWTLPQLIWLKRHEPENFAKIRKIMSMKDYVRYRLNHDYVTDTIEAMGFMLLDVRTNEWSSFLCGLCGIDTAILPKVVEPTARLKPLTPAAAAQTGLPADLYVAAGATDTVLEVFAAGAIHTGQATVKLATAGRICIVTDEPIIHKDLVCYRHIIPGKWYPGTGTKSCASSNRWYRDTLCQWEMEHYEDAYIKMDTDAKGVEPLSGGLFFHPYLQGELTPYQDEKLRGSFVGVRSYHTKAHFNRAVLEGIAFSLKDCYAAFQRLGAKIESATIIGGGAKSPLWRQIVADMLGIPLRKQKVDDSSLGAAMLAGVASGIFSSFENSVEKCLESDSTVTPNADTVSLYENGFKLYQAVHDALAPVYQKLEDLIP